LKDKENESKSEICVELEGEGGRKKKLI